MVDFSLLPLAHVPRRQPRRASSSRFAMLAQFFFIALYMQNILDYSPLQAGIRFLPSTVVIIVMGPLAGRLTDRVGPRPLMTAGLLIVAAALFVQSADHGPHRLPAAAARVRADGHRHGPRDVADEHRRDELGRPDQGRRRLRRAVDEPDGRRHLRRRRDGRADHDDRPLQDRRPACPMFRQARGRRWPTRSAAAASRSPRSAQVVDAVREAFVSALGTGLAIGAAVTFCRRNRRLGADRADPAPSAARAAAEAATAGRGRSRKPRPN